MSSTNDTSGSSRAEDRAIYRLEPDAPLTGLLTDIAGRADSLARHELDRPDLWPTVLKKLKIRWTTDSNAIEGSSLSFADTLFFLEQGLTVQGKPLKDFLDARNHTQAIEIAFDAVASRRPVTVGLLKELNALILSGVHSTPALDQFGRVFDKPATPGAYKSLPNHVIQPDSSLHTYVDPLHVSSEMQALCAFIEQQAEVAPVVVAALAHYDFVRIHPFDDGNGRCARLLMNLVLLRAGLPPTVIRNEDRAEYLTTLRLADAGDAHPFVGFIARSTLATITSMDADFEGSPK